MKRLLLALAAGLVLAAAAQSSTAQAPTLAQAFADLNHWRAEAGESRVLHFTAANDHACALHDHYMQLLGHLSHPEVAGRPGYTAAGAEAGPNSVLAEPEGLPEETWVDSVYHRMAVLQPRLRVSGFAAADGYVCMLTGGASVDDSAAARTTTLTLYPWPPRGATGQPVTFGHAADETPSPLIDAPGATSLGLLLSVDVNGPWVNHLAPESTLSSASLVSSSGVSIPLARSDATTKNGGYLDGGFALLPLRALQPGTEYTAHAAGTVMAYGTPYPFDLTWQFTTQAACTAPAIDAPDRVTIPASLKFSFPLSLVCNGDQIGGKQITMALVDAGQETALNPVSTYGSPATLTVTISRRGPDELVLRFAGGHGLAPTTHTIALSYS